VVPQPAERRPRAPGALLGFARSASAALPAALAALAALAAGLLLALAPVAAAALALALAAFGLAALAEPLVALGGALVVGPLRAYESIVLPGVLPLDSGQLAFGLVLVAWAGWIARRRALVIPRLPVLAGLLAFAGVAAVTLIGARSLDFGLPELIKWLEVAAMVVIVVDLAPDRRRLAVVVGLVLLAALVQAAIGVYQFAFSRDNPESFLILGRFYRAYGTFQQPNPYGGFIALALALAAGTLLGRLAHAGRAALRDPGVWALAGVALALAAALGMSWSRGAWLGFAAAAGAMLLAWPRRAWLGPLVAGGALSAGALLWGTGLLPGSVVARLTDFAQYVTFSDVRGVEINDENFAVVERLARWQAASDMWRDHLWLGVGLGNFPAAYADYRLIDWEYDLGHAHNIYLNMGAETGLLGLAAYLALWLVIFVQTLRVLGRLRGPWRGVALGLLGAWTQLSVHHLFDNLYVNNVHLHVGVMLGVLSALALWTADARGAQSQAEGRTA
jgi:O-antigen ligase